MRERVEPVRRVGKADLVEQFDDARASASRVTRRCSRTASAICLPIRVSGLRLVIGSWNTMPATPPRSRRSSPSPAPMTLCPSTTTRPAQAAPGGSSCSSDSAVSDLPEPLSPTSASVSPRSSVKLTLSDHGAAAEGDGQVLDRNQAHLGEPIQRRLARIERVAHRLADEHQQRQQPAQHDERGDAQPRRLQVVLALRHQFTQRRRSRRQAEAEEIQAGQDGHRAGQGERQEGQRRHHGVGQDMPPHHRHVGHAQRLGRAHIVQVAAAQEFGPHHAGQVHPTEQQQEHQQDPEARCDDAGEDDQQIELRHAGPDLDEALEQQIHQAAAIALDGAGGDADRPRKSPSA